MGGGEVVGRELRQKDYCQHLHCEGGGEGILAPPSLPLSQLEEVLWGREEPFLQKKDNAEFAKSALIFSKRRSARKVKQD